MINMNMDDAYEQAGEGGYTPIPVGDYPVVVENAEYKQFNSGNWGVSVQLSVVGHEKYDGRKLFDTFVLFESDGKTEMVRADKKSGLMKNFGKISYAGLCKAVGLTTAQAADPNNLLGKMVTVKTKIEAKDYSDPNGEKEAKPSYYKPVPTAGTIPQPAQGGFGGQQAPQQQAPQAAPQAAQVGFGQTNSFQRT